MGNKIVIKPEVFKFSFIDRTLIIRVLVVSSLAVLFLETLLTIILGFYLDLNNPTSLILDDLILMVLLIPINFVFIARPLAQQIAQRHAAQLASIENERRFKAVFNQTFQHCALLNSQGKILSINQTALDFFQMQPSDVLGLFLWELSWWHFTAENYAGAEQLKRAVKRAGRGSMVRSEQWVRSADGEKAMMDITLKSFQDEHGQINMLLYEARNITRRVLAEEAIRQNEDKIKILYDTEQRARQFAETLRDAVLSLSGSLERDEMLGMLLDYLNQFVPYTSAHLLLLEGEDFLYVHLARGEDEWPVQDQLYNQKFDLAKMDIFRPLLEQREVLLIGDTQVDEGDLLFPQNPRVRSWLALPLLTKDKVIGVCMLEHNSSNFFTETMVRWATALIGQASVSLQNAWLFDQVRNGREQLQALSRRLVEVQENEHRAIARELHDEVGQALASLKIGLNRVEYDNSDPAEVIASSRELKQMADEVLENIHRLAVDLRPPSLDRLGLVPALHQYAERMIAQHGLAVHFETAGSIERFPDEMETAIYRIVQEFMTNVALHAQATRADILLQHYENRIIVVIEDDGVGFDPLSPHENRLGLLGMQERAIMLGGKLTIESSPAEGTSIILEVPWISEF